MNTQMIIEAVGYIGSLLVLVSFLMTSVVKLRIVNTIGSVIFMIYALIIRSYPTAVMNFCLVLINLRFLLKMRDTNREYDLVEVKANDEYLKYLLGHYEEDIKKCFPGIVLNVKESDAAYIVSHDGKPVGITLVRGNEADLEFLLDYSVPEYRDLSIGTYLLGQLKEKGIRKVIYRGPTENHLSYLNGMGFKEEEDHYARTL